MASLTATSPAKAEEPAQATTSPQTAPQQQVQTPEAKVGGTAGVVGTDNPYVTREDLDALKDILDESIKRGVGSNYLISLSGYVIAGFYSGASASTNLGGTGTQSFGINSAGLTLTGNLREDPVEEFDVRYRLGLLFSGNAPKYINSVSLNTKTLAIGTGAGQVQAPVLGDVYLQTDIRTNKKELNPLWTLSATLGQKLIPFGQDNLSTEDQRPTIRVAQYLGPWAIGRDVGLQLDGGLVNRYDPGSGITSPLIGYQLAVWNGTGANRWDDNAQKDFNGRIVITPESQYLSLFRGLTFGGSTYIGLEGVGPKAQKQLGGWEVSWLRKPFLITAEGVYGRLPKASNLGTYHSTDYVATLFWTPNTLPDFQPLFRYDIFDPNTDVSGDRNTTYTIGFNYFLYQTEPVTRRTYAAKETVRVLKIQANWNLQKKDGRPLAANDWAVQVVANF